MTVPTSSNLDGNRPRILLSDDQYDIVIALELLLKMNGYQTKGVYSPVELAETAGKWPFDLILMDLNYSRDTTSGREGLDLLIELRANHPSAPIIVMTAWGNVELAVEAMRLGALDFVQKPWDNARLLETVSKGLARAAEVKSLEAARHSELEIARHVQQNLLPQRLKPMARMDYAGHCVPAQVVAGDYYDFFDMGEGRLGMTLADVSGKGVGAAMLMANLQACLRTQLEAGVRQPEILLQTVNRLFFECTSPAQYVTLFFGEYEEESATLRYINCGHLSPVLLRSSGTIERLDATGTVLGLFRDWSHPRPIETQLSPGDTLVGFTDGITEAVLPFGDEYGDDGLLSAVQNSQAYDVQQAAQHVVELGGQVDATYHAADDRTAIVLRIK